MDLEAIRREYLRGGLNREDLLDDPFDQFDQWMQQAIEMGLSDPTAMTMATVSSDGQPSQRIVLLKHLDRRGFVFYTNYASRKAKELAGNTRVSLHFPWHSIERQVHVCGKAEKVSAAESLKYFLTRPRESQLAAWASEQSASIDTKLLLIDQYEAMRRKFAEGRIPLPDHWGGFRVVPHELEFWQGGKHRLHDRFQYRFDGTGQWEISRLAP
ncbi:MAG: pyridoxamine 5'-phosphate oxidase [Pseudohongiellaceae bacterium]